MMFYPIEEVRFNEPDYYRVFSENRDKFSKFNGYRNNCANTVRTYLSILGMNAERVTAWADTVRQIGEVFYDPNQLKEGDIVAMGRPGNTWHVGVYLGHGKVLHQSAMRGYVVGAYYDLRSFINDRRGFYAVRPVQSYQNLLKDQFYTFPTLS
jgi:hypothetical protein